MASPPQTTAMSAARTLIMTAMYSIETARHFNHFWLFGEISATFDKAVYLLVDSIDTFLDFLAILLAGVYALH